jgi:photosystem II stability/assembly factor-like uncharacterized protein
MRPLNPRFVGPSSLEAHLEHVSVSRYAGSRSRSNGVRVPPESHIHGDERPEAHVSPSCGVQTQRGTLRPLDSITCVLAGLFCVLVVAAADPPLARAGWNPSPSPTTEPLFGVCYAGYYEAWAVGLHGTVLHSSDAGRNWVLRTPLNSWYLWDVSFFDSQTGMITAEDRVYGTTDGGATWVSHAPPYGAAWLSVQMVDAQTAVIGGEAHSLDGTFGITTDGGRSWYQRGLSDLLHGDGAVLSVCFWSATSGFAVGVGWYGSWVMRTDDAGRSWSMVYKRTDWGDVRAGAILSPRQLVACGSDGLAIYTTNGTDWRSTSAPTLGCLSSVSYAGGAPRDHWPGVVAVGENGAAVRSDDGGRTWRAQASGTSADLYAVAFTSKSVGVAVGDRGTIVWTDTGGESGEAGRSEPGAVETASDDGHRIDPSRGPVIEAVSDPLPNPFRERTTLFLDRCPDGPLRIDIFDAAGRWVFHSARPAASGSGRIEWNGRIEWDGRTDGGWTAPPGVYLLRVQDPGFDTGRPLVRRLVFLGR